MVVIFLFSLTHRLWIYRNTSIKSGTNFDLLISLFGVYLSFTLPLRHINNRFCRRHCLFSSFNNCQNVALEGSVLSSTLLFNKDLIVTSTPIHSFITTSNFKKVLLNGLLLMFGSKLGTTDLCFFSHLY